MLEAYNESSIIERAGTGDSFRTVNFLYIIIYKGYISIDMNDSSFNFKKGNVILLLPNRVYKIEGFSTDIKAYVLSIDMNVMREKVNFNFNRYDMYRIANIEIGRTIISPPETDFNTVKVLSEQIFYYLNKKNQVFFKEEVMLSSFLTITYIIAGEILKLSEKSSVLYSRKENIVMKFIESSSFNYKKNKELGFYAGELLISIKYLSNCVREITGFPPTRFIADALVNEAKIMLFNSKYTVGMISDDLGFSDQYAFGKFFKKHTGYSPKKFKSKNSYLNDF